ncbi:MAG: hypothetical protein H0U74_00170, partial [Bradymonadaceae bacterium]|nr:hypothetical protein [Lujinxingiaceae bacterium]
MSMQFTGIENVNEFYTTHYLAAILEGDLKGTVFKEWSEQGDERKPHEKLRALATDFFKFKAQLDDEENLDRRLTLHREFASKFLYALGYEPGLRHHDLAHGTVPVIAEVRRSDGAPVLWCIQAVDAAAGEQEDPLNLPLVEAPSIQELISAEIFARDEPPRFVLVFGESQVLLIDRTKWPEKRLLRFDLVDLLGRKETDTLMVMAALLERRRIWSDDGQSLLDTLDESSHKHAFSVSEDLKYALREAIELLGNEAVHYIREVKKQKLFERGLDAELSRECLRYMYRLLFLFYIEARPELGYAPIGNDAYLKGYSLESLRGLELVELTTDESLNGTYLHESLALLFELIFKGAKPANQTEIFSQGLAEPIHGIFQLAPLRAHLFDPAATPILSGVKLRNHVLQRIIELMSLSRGSDKGRGKDKRRGRISYAQLGINQLGAVYEALLSYRGFFAEEDLYEVKRKDNKYDPLETAYFVGK